MGRRPPENSSFHLPWFTLSLGDTNLCPEVNMCTSFINQEKYAYEKYIQAHRERESDISNNWIFRENLDRQSTNIDRNIDREIDSNSTNNFQGEIS